VKGKEVQLVTAEADKEQGSGKAEQENARSTSHSEEVASSVDKASGSASSGFNEESFFVGETE
jgi:hypothetical protein